MPTVWGDKMSDSDVDVTLSTDSATPTVRVLPDYEPTARPTPPDEDDAFVPPQRWSSLRPASRIAVDLPVDPADASSVSWPRRFGNGHSANVPVCALLTKILEAVDGRRQVDQLRGVLADTVYEATLTRARITAAAGVRHQLRSVHSWHITSEVIEICGLVETVNGARRPRANAMAARMELRAGRWRCTVLRLAS